MVRVATTRGGEATHPHTWNRRECECISIATRRDVTSTIAVKTHVPSSNTKGDAPYGSIVSMVTAHTIKHTNDSKTACQIQPLVEQDCVSAPAVQTSQCG